MSSFLHGVEVLSVDSGPRPIRSVRSAVIGLVGTAPKGPINTPVLIAGSRTEAVKLFGKGVGTIPDALDAIFDQGGALVVVINVLDPATHKVAVVQADFVFGADDTLILPDAYNASVVVKDQADAVIYVEGDDYSIDTDTGIVTRIAAGDIAAEATVKINYDKPDPAAVVSADVVGGVDAGTGAYQGVHGLLGAESVVHVTPKILCAPAFTGERPGDVANPVVAELVGISDRLRAIIVTDGPNTTDADAITYRGDWGSKRVYVHDPYHKVWDGDANAAIDMPPSGRIAGVIAANDDRGNGGGGFWTSPSNRLINGIVGTTRAVDFAFGDKNCRANLLNEQEVATTIRQDGYRLWGNRTCSADPKWAFLSHVRLEDMILESLLRAHLWAVDRNITKTYAEDVVEGVNAYLAKLVNDGAISGGLCWFDPELNTKVEMDAGKAFFDFEYGRYGVAERVTFRAAVNNDYTIEAVFG
jgi:hypothetical protein